MESSLCIESCVKEKLMKASDLMGISACKLSKLLIHKVCQLNPDR